MRNPAPLLDELRNALSEARSVVALTGAGISAESGVPVFRGDAGLWRSFSPTELATPEAFEREPGLVWEWYAWRREVIASTRPNRGHLALGHLERACERFLLVTQNVDGLHARAGSRSIIELHGNIWRARCTRRCGIRPLERLETIPPRCGCGALLRPDVVWFGEPLERSAVDEARSAASSADVFLSIGTSALVHPAADLPLIAKHEGAFLVEINTEPTVLSQSCDLCLRSGAAELLPSIAAPLSSRRD